MIFDANDNAIDTLNVALNSGVNKVYTLEIDCYTGHFAYNGFIDSDGVHRTAPAIADVTIEFRHGTSGSYSDIENTPFDLSAWNGSRETFQLRITAGTITALHLVRAMLLMVGPEPAALTFLTNEGGDLLTNDSGVDLIA